jgi:hypothetical protein
LGLKNKALRKVSYYIENDLFNTCSYERGNMFEKETTDNIEKAVYWILYDITRSYTCAYELKHRIRYTDSRRQWIKLLQESFDIFGQPYKDMLQNDIDIILQRSPFNDVQSCKLDLFKDYEKTAVLLKDSLQYKNSPLCRTIVDRILTSYRINGGIPDFDNSYKKIRNDIIELQSFFSKEQNTTEIKDILVMIKNIENIEQKYLKSI